MACCARSARARAQQLEQRAPAAAGVLAAGASLSREGARGRFQSARTSPSTSSSWRPTERHRATAIRRAAAAAASCQPVAQGASPRRSASGCSRRAGGAWLALDGSPADAAARSHALGDRLWPTPRRRQSGASLPTGDGQPPSGCGRCGAATRWRLPRASTPCRASRPRPSLLFVRRREKGATSSASPRWAARRRAGARRRGRRLVPDGRRIAFILRPVAPRWLVGVAASDGGDERLVSRENACRWAARWSPTGRWLACAAHLARGAADSVLLPT